MAQIINFLEARDALALNNIKRRLQEKEEEKQEKEKTKKRAKIITAMPGETIPEEYRDLRPFLQRDGLILLSWAVWDDYENEGLHYRANWVKSCGKMKHYACFWKFQNDRELQEDLPNRTGDRYYREGIIDRWLGKQAADIVFLCAPEFSRESRPHFIQLLKATGIKVDFDYEFSLGKAKEIEFSREQQEIMERLEKLQNAGIS